MHLLCRLEPSELRVDVPADTQLNAKNVRRRTRTPLLSEQRMQFDQEQLNRLLLNGQIAMSNSRSSGARRYRHPSFICAAPCGTESP